jgi:hypothetical protein
MSGPLGRWHFINLGKLTGTGAAVEFIKSLSRGMNEKVSRVAWLQREFAREVTAVDKLKTAQRASLAELDALFATPNPGLSTENFQAVDINTKKETHEH